MRTKKTEKITWRNLMTDVHALTEALNDFYAITLAMAKIEEKCPKRDEVYVGLDEFLKRRFHFNSYNPDFQTAEFIWRLSRKVYVCVAKEFGIELDRDLLEV